MGLFGAQTFGKMLAGCPSGLQSREIFLRLPCRIHRNSPLRTLGYFPTRKQSTRFYGRMLRTVISKHVASFTETIRPVLPFPSTSSFEQPAERNTPVGQSANSTYENDSLRKSLGEKLSSSGSVSNPTSDATNNVRNKVRLMMRKVPHPVAIITSTDPTSSEVTAFRGMTVSSFNTVTLHPQPVVSFNIKLPSETYNAIDTSSRFLVHLLSPRDVTAKLAWEFAKGSENIAQGERGRLFKFLSPSSPDSQPSINDGEPPRLAVNSHKTPVSSTSIEEIYFPVIFECQYLRRSVKVGDHIIVLGTVINTFGDEGHSERRNNSMHGRDELCLTYADTRFWHMGKNITFDSNQDN